MIPRDSEGRVNFDKVFNLYKGSEARAVASQKQYDAAIAEGFGDYVAQEFPRWIYHQKTNSPLLVASAQEEASKEGYGRTPIAIPKQEEKMNPLPMAVPHNDYSGAIQALEQNAAQQAKALAALTETIARIETALTEPAGKRR